jgi:DNA invertase Pin-like site-specific DNA recombinase
MINLGMKTKKARTEQAAEQIASIVEAHLEKLTPAERADRLHAFRQVVAKIGSEAKSREPRAASGSPPAALRRA